MTLGSHVLQIGELPIESGMLTKSLDEAQRKVPSDTFLCRLPCLAHTACCMVPSVWCCSSEATPNPAPYITAATLGIVSTNQTHITEGLLRCTAHWSADPVHQICTLCASCHLHALTRTTGCAQVEAYFFDQRRQLFEYDQVLNTQRDKVYGQRRRALLSRDLSPQMLEFAERTVDDILEVLLRFFAPSF